ncbi:hypothetical protein ER308_11775 [Egibacter rhizosphaerae]|uniref:LiaF transmembrane domain-containing protein n=1 Tax=Egibacter rhizosphaerae TaxID=1670831 RepID=A0A411YFY1_9ACTN|nr:DUF5668 domain-containing protein [Egibacter rhizosphaerae]QBI20175.1 hypothetical protein ER308_11775 [Egibacter rhizosphaerae]
MPIDPRPRDAERAPDPEPPDSARPAGTESIRPGRTREPLRVGPLLAGLVFIVLGGTLALGQLGVLDVDVWAAVRQLWPLVLVAVGGGMLLERRWLEGATITLIGLLLLGSTTGVTPGVGFELIVPILIIAVGIGIIAGAVRRPGGALGSTALFGGLEREVDPSEPAAHAVTAIFGGYEVRVADREPASGARLSALAVFGGVDIEVPESVPVRIIRRSGLFGSVESKVHEASHREVAYEIEASALFGGVEVTRR